MPVHTRLAEIRKAREISAADLARSAGVTRQTIYAIEDGTFLPNTAVSLRLARSLQVSVEEIFALDDEPAIESLTVAALPGEPLEAGQLVKVCQVNDRYTAVPTSFLPAYLPAADGVVESTDQHFVHVRTPAAPPESGKRILLAGCDPALSLLHQSIASSGMEIVTVSCSSRRALDWLKQGRVHAAGSHLRDRVTGDYNVPVVRTMFPDPSVRVITFAIWEEGLVVAKGNPKGIRSVADLAGGRIRIMNREKGAGSRDLLDKALREARVPANQVKGYVSVAPGHLAAAYAVHGGTADCCIAPLSAARRFGLDFIPLAVERFDLSLLKSALDLPAVKALVNLLNTSIFRKKLQCIAGYETSHTGEVLL